LRHPPYHLRSNKAIDRLALIDTIKRLGHISDLRSYTYYGMGGPYLEEFRVLSELHPEIRMVCIEEDEETFKRQQFHLPCRSSHLKFEKMSFSTFVARFEATDAKSIVWADFTGLEYRHFADFMDLLPKVGADSIVKITVRCSPEDYRRRDQAEELRAQEEFKQKFEMLWPGGFEKLPTNLDQFALLTQHMARIAAQQALPAPAAKTFLPISAFVYNDGTNMYSLTGAICLRTRERHLRHEFRRWPFANLDWEAPRRIKVPDLSTKERLHLQRHLPRRGNAGKKLRCSLGYLIDRNEAQTEIQLQQYADYHRFFPYFIKGTP
jgi:hypothetical protein